MTPEQVGALLRQVFVQENFSWGGVGAVVLKMLTRTYDATQYEDARDDEAKAAGLAVLEREAKGEA